LPGRLLPAVVRPQISTSPAAFSAAAAALYLWQRFLCFEPLDRQLAMMVTGPLAHAVGAD